MIKASVIRCREDGLNYKKNNVVISGSLGKFSLLLGRNSIYSIIQLDYVESGERGNNNQLKDLSKCIIVLRVLECLVFRRSRGVLILKVEAPALANTIVCYNAH